TQAAQGQALTLHAGEQTIIPAQLAGWPPPIEAMDGNELARWNTLLADWSQNKNLRPQPGRVPDTIPDQPSWPPVPSTKVVYDFIAQANVLNWVAGPAAAILPWGGDPDDKRGRALWREDEALNDGTIAGRVLETHP